MQIGQRVHAAGVQQFTDGQQNAGQVAAGNAGDAEHREVGISECRRGLTAQRSGHDAADDGGQGVELGVAVHRGGCLGIDHVVQQAGFGCGVDAGQTQHLVLRWAELHIVVGAVAICPGEQLVVGVDDGLHFGCSVGGSGGQWRDEAVEACHVAAGDARDAGLSVSAVGGCGVGAGVSADHAHGGVELGHRSRDRGLQG